MQKIDSLIYGNDLGAVVLDGNTKDDTADTTFIHRCEPRVCATEKRYKLTETER